MTGDIAVINIAPTLFLKKDAGILKQLIRIRISNRNPEPLAGRLSLKFCVI